MMVEIMTLEQVRATGYRVLSRELGPVDTIRFIQQFEMGYGDYSRERHEWLDHYTIEGIVQEIQMRGDVNAASSADQRGSAREVPRSHVADKSEGPKQEYSGMQLDESLLHREKGRLTTT